MEFAACQACNNGTKGADVVASVFARIWPTDEATTPSGSRELNQLIRALDKDAPGLRASVFDMRKAEKQWVRTKAGILVQQIVLNGNDPLLNSYLAVFGAKMGMALYREYVKEPLPLDGCVHVEYFLNAGLSEENASVKLRMLPMHTPFEQGSFSVKDQFDYRYNTDTKTIVAALLHFNENLYFFVIATSETDRYRQVFDSFPHGEVIRPGELLTRLPKPKAITP